jgi:hypothetical protein
MSSCGPFPEAHGVGPAALDRGLGGAGDQFGGGGVVDAVARLDRAVAEDRGQHRLANARRPDQQQVRFVFEKPERGEVFDQAPVQARLGAEVELIERAACGELGEPQASLQAALLDGDDFVGE